MKSLVYLFRYDWPWLSLTTILGLAGGISSAGMVAIIGQVISALTVDHDLMWLFFALCATALVARFFTSAIIIRLTQDTGQRLRMELSLDVLRTPYARLQALGPAELTTILTGDIATLTQACHILPLMFSDVVMVVVCLSFLCWVSPPLFGLLIALCAGGGVLYGSLVRAPAAHARILRQEMETVHQHFSDLIAGAKELQLNAQRRDAFLREDLEPSVRTFRQRFVQAMTGFMLASQVGTSLFFFGIGVLLFTLPGWHDVPALTVNQFALMLLYLIGPIGSITANVPAIRQGTVALERIGRLRGQLGGESCDQAGPDPLSGPGRLQLQLRGLHFSYPGDEPDQRFTLGPLNLAASAGEIVYIVGGNGSGKTSLALLMLGYYQPDAGTIELNGHVIDAARREDYRQFFSAVLSDFHLFDRVPGGDDALPRARAYLEKLRIDHKVGIAAGRFSTTRLSSGQRKRLALVQAYLEDRPIYVFDEWAADQDPEFKHVFYTELLPELKRRGKLVFVVTHDDAYFHCADKIFKLIDGQLQTPRIAPAGNAAPVLTR